MQPVNQNVLNQLTELERLFVYVIGRITDKLADINAGDDAAEITKVFKESYVLLNDLISIGL